MYFLGNGNGTFQKAVTYHVGNRPNGMAVADFNADRNGDLVTANWVSREVSVLLGNADGTFQPEVRYPIGSGPYSIAVGDFNGDGLPDIAATPERIFNGTTVNVILNSGQK